MERQLQLLEPSEPEWQIDDRTKEIGRRGVAAVREAMQRARRAAATEQHADAA